MEERSLFKRSRSHNQAGRMKFGMQHRVLKYHQVYSNDDPGLTMTYFIGKKVKQKDFSGTIVVYDIKVGRCS